MNIYERIVNTWKPFLPLKTGGFCTTGECALWANDNIRQVYPGIPIGGHAWTRFMYGNDNGGLSGYSNMPDNYLPEDNKRNFIASQTYNPAYNLYSNYLPYRLNKPRQLKRGSGKRVKVQRIER